MSNLLQNRLKQLEKLTGKSGKGKQPGTVEHTSDGQYYVLDRDARTLIGGEDDFQRWQANGNRAWAIIEGLTPVGSELVRRVISGERTEHKERK